MSSALQELEKIQQSDDLQFDLVFLDADKKSYVSYLSTLLGGRGRRCMLADGALIITDNVLWKGLVLNEVTTTTVIMMSKYITTITFFIVIF